MHGQPRLEETYFVQGKSLIREKVLDRESVRRD